MSGEFQHGLFGCFGNCCICVCTWFCPCYVAGKVAEKVGDSCILCALVFFCPIANLICMSIIRQKVREQKGISGSFIMDLVVMWCCAPCAVCQEAQEVNALDSMAQSIVRE